MHGINTTRNRMSLAIRMLTIKLTGVQKRSFWTSSERSERQLSALLAGAYWCVVLFLMLLHEISLREPFGLKSRVLVLVLIIISPLLDRNDVLGSASSSCRALC